MKNTFTTLEENIDKFLYENSALASSDSKDSSGNIHFQFRKNSTSFTGNKKFKTDPEDYVKIPGVNYSAVVLLKQASGERNIKLLLKKSHTKSIKLDIRNIILLNIQSTMDLLYNIKLVENIYKAKKKMRL